MARIIPAVVRGGAVVVDHTLDVADGTRVRILVADEDDDFVLTPEEEAELEVALEESDRGQGVRWEEARRQLFGRARVKDGVLVPEGMDLAEGAAVIVIADNNESRDPFAELDRNGGLIMTPELEAELEAAEAEIARGEFITADELRESLQRTR
jgi:hypothetical protein